MIEIIMNSSASFLEVYEDLKETQDKAGKKGYTPQVYIRMGLPSFKSRKQNSLFHGLLGMLWESGCSSYLGYDDMRKHYKKLAGLIKIEHCNNLISDEGKSKIWNACKDLDLSDDDLWGFIELMKGRIEIESSWSDAKKSKATSTIKCLMNEMDESNVAGSSVGNKYMETVNYLERDKVGKRIFNNEK